DWSDDNADIVWAIPPYMRKRSNKRRAHMNHEVVLIGWVARTARRLDILAYEQGYHFPAKSLGGRRTKNPYADSGFINHALQYMPGVDMSCHSWRRGFASHGQRELGFSLNDIKLGLDHSWGARRRRRDRRAFRAGSDDREEARDYGKMACLARATGQGGDRRGSFVAR